MHGLIREEHSFGSNPSTKDLTRHLYIRMACGRIVIVADKPNTLLATLRKQWLRLCRKVQKESASTLNATRIYELSEVITHMQNLEFSTKWSPDEYLTADVYLASVEDLVQWAPECRTLYVTCEMEPEQLHLVTAWMPKGSLVIICKFSQTETQAFPSGHSTNPTQPSVQ